MARENSVIQMRTTGDELRQFLYVDDCSKCMEILMNKFDEIDDKEIDVSSFKWISIADVAKEISQQFSNCPVYPGAEIDDLQRNALNDPKKDILKYWKPEISISAGIKKLIEND